MMKQIWFCPLRERIIKMSNNILISLIPFFFGLINLPLALKNLYPYWFSWFALGFCFCIAYSIATKKG